MESNQKDVIEIETIADNVTTKKGSSKLCDLTTLKDTLNPLLVSLKIFGTVYCDHLPGSHSERNRVGFLGSSGSNILSKDCSKSWRHILGLCYCAFVAFIGFLPVFHAALELSEKQSLVNVMSRSFFFSWVLLSLCQHVSCAYLTSFRWKNEKNRFDKFVDAMVFVRAESVKKTKICVWRIVRAGWTCLILNYLTMIMGGFSPMLNSMTRKEVLKIFIGRSKWSVANHSELSYGYIFICIVMTGIWSIPSCFYVSLCMMLTGCFDDLYERASRDVKMNTINLEELRDEFVRLCNALSALNDLLSPLGMLMFSIYVPAICLNINVCLQTFREGLVVSQVAHISWIFLNSFVLLTLSIYGAKVNESSGRLSELVHNINAKDLGRKEEIELMLLLSNLNSNYASLTVGGVLVLTKEMILTLFGTIVGYLTIIVQFK